MKKNFFISTFFAMLLLIPSSIMAMDNHQDCSYINKIQSLDELTKKDVPCIAMSVSEQLNKRTPLTVDRNTILLSTIAINNTLNYKYKMVNLGDSTKISDSDWNILTTQLKKDVLTQNCSNPMLKKMIDLGIVVSHVYHDDNLKHRLTALVSTDTCSTK